MKHKTSDCLMNYERTCLISENIVDVISVGMDEFMLINYPHDDTGYSIAIYTKSDKALENSKTMISYDVEVMKIVEEEAQAYFAGKQDAAKTVQIIQKRCDTYMSEKR